MALHSPHWHRVAALRPTLVPQVRVRRQHLRGATWWLLADPLTGRSCRLDHTAYALAGRLDGARSVQALWDELHHHQDDAPTQDETLDLLARLREQGLIDAGSGADLDTLRPHLAAIAPARPQRGLLAWRMPLGDPAAWLRRLDPWARPLFTQPAAVVLAGALLWLLGAGIVHAGELAAYAERWAMTARFVLIALLAYLPIKLLHELGHGLAVQHLGGPHGGQVREAGVTWMLGLPLPYVDASAASSWPGRGRRMVVSAAGVLVELAIAALALAAWLALDDGLGREMAFAAFSIGALSTLLFNANPLMRLDGYFLLTDALQLPNLAPRSRAWWMNLIQRRWLHQPEIEPLPVAAGERRWLLAYAPLSWSWSLVIAAMSVAWLAAVSAPVGALAGVLLGIQLVVRPVWRLWHELHRLAQAAQGDPLQRLRRAGLGLAALALGVLAVPMPRQTVAQGVVWPPELAQLRAGTEGFVSELHAADGQAVEAGDLVLTLANPRLLAEREQALARQRALETEFLQAASTEPDRGANPRAELQLVQAELARIDERISGLQVRAATAGRLALPGAADLPGQYLAQGKLIGQVLTGEPDVLRVALPDDEARQFRDRVRGVSVRLADARGREHAAVLLRDGGGAGRDLPSPALSQHHGGPVLTDPQDTSHIHSLRPVVWMDVQLVRAPNASTDPTALGSRLGLRGWVRFDEGWSPWGWQLLEASNRRWQRLANPEH